jgi:hypothetical protein
MYLYIGVKSWQESMQYAIYRGTFIAEILEMFDIQSPGIAATILAQLWKRKCSSKP